MKPLPAFAALSLGPLALSACAVIPDAPNVEGIPAPPGSAVAIDQPVRMGDMVVTPKAIVEDSRCAKARQCVWAGRLIVRTRIDGAGWRDSADITLGTTYGTHGRVIAFVGVSPEKVAGGEIRPEAYRFRYEPR